MTTFALDTNGDLIRTDSGSYLLVDGLNEITERIIRRAVTNPSGVSATGQAIAGDYIYHPDYGLGLAAYVEGVTTSDIFQKLSSIIRQAVLEDIGTDKNFEPEVIAVEQTFDTLSIGTKFRTVNGEQGDFTLDFQLPSP